jgi:hypothetical protein
MHFHDPRCIIPEINPARMPATRGACLFRNRIVVVPFVTTEENYLLLSLSQRRRFDAALYAYFYVEHIFSRKQDYIDNMTYLCRMCRSERVCVIKREKEKEREKILLM